MDSKVRENLEKRKAAMTQAVHRVWTDEELEILHANFPTKTMTELQTLLPGKSPYKITETAKFLGLKKVSYRPKNTTRWTPDEIKILKENYTSMEIEELAKLLPGRTINAIILKAQALYNK